MFIYCENKNFNIQTDEHVNQAIKKKRTQQQR